MVIGFASDGFPIHGPYERQGDTVIATLDSPDEASLGVLLDCHVEFREESPR